MSIKEYALFIKRKLNLNIKIKFDQNKKIDGTPRKILDCSIAKSYGWKSKITLDQGFNQTYKHFLKHS